MLPRRTLVLLEFAGWALLLLLSCLAGGLGHRWRRGRWRCGRFLGRHRDDRRRRGIDIVIVASIDWSLRGSVAVRVRFAVGFSRRTAVRARATATTTMRASAFGHATMFVMGCLLALSRRHLPACSRCSCGSRGRTYAHASP
jgi:hypothetical protein